MGIWILLGCIVFLILFLVFSAYICFYHVFYSPKRKPFDPDRYETPPGEIYEPYREGMIGWMKEVRAMPHEDVEITSFDGLTLRGKYYECKSGAPMEILFHGYHGNADRDLSGGVKRCFAIGRNALVVNQRGSGPSDGSVITFGVKERRDCVAWVNYAVERFGKDIKIVITGISMGASTVMMAAAEDLPPNVVCVLADCGYTSAREIIQRIMRNMHLPVRLFYPLVKLSARLFGHFDLEETSPMEAMKKSRVPVIFIHGEADDFVPCDMSRALYEACASQKKLVTIPDAGHGLAYPLAQEGYKNALLAFQSECGF